MTLRFEPWAPMPYDGTLTISADHTSGTSTLSVSGTGTRPPGRGVFGIMTDATGDALPYPNLASPDLVGASIDVSAGALTLTFAFVPGTLSANVRSVAFLDTDENTATGGSLSGDGGLLGADYIIALVDEWNSGRGAIARWDGQVFRRVGTAPVAFTGTEARIAFPTSLLGNDDGRLGGRGKTADYARLPSTAHHVRVQQTGIGFELPRCDGETGEQRHVELLKLAAAAASASGSD